MLEPGIVKPADAMLGRHDIWHPDVNGTHGADRIGEALRHDADDLVAGAFTSTGPAFEILDRDGPSDDSGVSAKVTPPQSIAQDRDPVRSRSLVARFDRAPDRRSDSQHVEEAAGHAKWHERLGLRARFPQRQPSAAERANGIEDLLL
jgi:hypothetical protein